MLASQQLRSYVECVSSRIRILTEHWVALHTKMGVCIMICMVRIKIIVPRSINLELFESKWCDVSKLFRSSGDTEWVSGSFSPSLLHL
jgi:hypothetical protein